MKSLVRVPLVIGGALLVGSVVGCMTGSRSQGTPVGAASSRPSVVASPLQSQLHDSGTLASVNSISIELPSLPGGNISAGVSPAEAGALIERVARQTMTLKVVGPSRRTYGESASAADAVLRTEILRFDELQGSAFGGEPAVVSFRMSLDSRRKQTSMWSAQYFLKQEAVSENLLRLGERVGPSGLGVGWRSATEVFERGISAALTDLNSQREKQFLVKDRAGGLR
jgi:hypothetical protein